MSSINPERKLPVNRSIDKIIDKHSAEPFTLSNYEQRALFFALRHLLTQCTEFQMYGPSTPQSKKQLDALKELAVRLGNNLGNGKPIAEEIMIGGISPRELIDVGEMFDMADIMLHESEAPEMGKVIERIVQGEENLIEGEYDAATLHSTYMEIMRDLHNPTKYRSETVGIWDQNADTILCVRIFGWEEYPARVDLMVNDAQNILRTVRFEPGKSMESWVQTPSNFKGREYMSYEEEEELNKKLEGRQLNYPNLMQLAAFVKEQIHDPQIKSPEARGVRQMQYMASRVRFMREYNKRYYQ